MTYSKVAYHKGRDPERSCCLEQRVNRQNDVKVGLYWPDLTFRRKKRNEGT